MLLGQNTNEYNAEEKCDDESDDESVALGKRPSNSRSAEKNASISISNMAKNLF